MYPVKTRLAVLYIFPDMTYKRRASLFSFPSFHQSQTATFTSSPFKMSFKITHLIALAFAMLLVVMSTHQAEAQKFPIWCFCDSNVYTGIICTSPLAGGNFDGGSCGLDNYTKYSRFVGLCKNAKDSKHQLSCWN
ncbi:hypothetical protein K457DRAFT_26660 [Linnemannia elongata AG-77]|uniref:Uncharacterized protein n=1 Tax=Linnemannia elongata AG-77 TaxID=1314771 RepID=A0A197JBN1_9FUNG|nr:hypothetical protein K457DRAFT_26660 [Linnemannia elongata AG-77]